MKKTLAILFGAAALAASCTNLDEVIYSQIPKDTFLQDPANVALYTSRPYTALQSWGAEQSMLTLIIQVTNETAIPKSFNGFWTEPRYGELQSHDWPENNKLIRCGWDFCFDGIAACNDAIYALEGTPSNETIEKSIAEIKVLRAYYYLMAVDCFGNVPYSVSKTESGYPEQKDRKFMLNFIENEIKDNMAKLDTDASAATYGRVTRGMALFLLAKIYLNSEKWTGSARYGEAETVCKEIMDSGEYELAAKYSDNFALNNENGSEAVFAIPHSSVYTNYAFYIYVMTLNEDLSTCLNIPGASWNGTEICQPDFFESYEEGDTRKDDTWLYGQVYTPDGSKFKYKSVLTDGTEVMTDYVINPAPISEERYSTGLDRFDGARIIKWPYQTDGSLTGYKVSMENDFYLMRYSDVVLMYVEALVRQNRVGEAAAVEEFRQIRTRAGLAPFTEGELTLDALYLERMHELALEGWGRQDMIRFGKFTQAWWAKDADNADGHTELFPIPSERRADNPNLLQNNGYN